MKPRLITIPWSHYCEKARWALDRAGVAYDVLDRGVPRWQTRAFRIGRPVIGAMMRRGMNITPAGVARSRDKIAEAFARVDALLRDGRRYLTGDRFGVADLTFAALASIIVLPREHPFGLPQLDDFTGDARRELEAWRASRPGQFALRRYAEHRTDRPGPWPGRSDL